MQQPLKVAVRVCAALALVAGCDPAEISRSAQLGNRSRSVMEDNGLSMNGLMANGLLTNGLTVNGYHFNGYHFNGYHFNGFSINDLAQDESLNLMKYMTRCALAPDQTMTILTD